jgi:hypothetical protein
VEITVVMEEGVVLRRGSLVLAPSEEKSTVVLVPPFGTKFSPTLSGNAERGGGHHGDSNRRPVTSRRSCAFRPPPAQDVAHDSQQGSPPQSTLFHLQTMG